MKTLFLSMLSAAAAVGVAQATVTFEYQVGWNPGVSAGTIGVLVVDTAGDGFGEIGAGETLDSGTFFGADDLILDRTVAVDLGLGGPLGFAGNVSSLALTGGIDAGDQIALFWFDGPVNEPLAAGQTYGSYRTDTFDPASGANGAFVIPADGSTINLFAFSSEFTGDGGSAANAAFLANNSMIIPEPGSMALVGLASAGLLLRRRRR